MKSFKILLASALLVTHTYAMNKSDRNLLIGITAGTVLGTFYAKEIYKDKHYVEKKYPKHHKKYYQCKRKKHHHTHKWNHGRKRVDFRSMRDASPQRYSYYY